MFVLLDVVKKCTLMCIYHVLFFGCSASDSGYTRSYYRLDGERYCKSNQVPNFGPRWSWQASFNGFSTRVRQIDLLLAIRQTNPSILSYFPCHHTGFHSESAVVSFNVYIISCMYTVYNSLALCYLEVSMCICLTLISNVLSIVFGLLVVFWAPVDQLRVLVLSLSSLFSRSDTCMNLTWSIWWMNSLWKESHSIMLMWKKDRRCTA